MNCPVCGSVMTPLFVSFFCHNDCDRKTKQIKYPLYEAGYVYLIKAIQNHYTVNTNTHCSKFTYCFLTKQLARQSCDYINGSSNNTHFFLLTVQANNNWIKLSDVEDDDVLGVDFKENVLQLNGSKVLEIE